MNKEDQQGIEIPKRDQAENLTLKNTIAEVNIY